MIFIVLYFTSVYSNLYFYTRGVHYLDMQFIALCVFHKRL